MAGFRPVDPKQSFPELEERILERWRERDVFHRSLASARTRRCGASTRGRRPPTASPARTTSSRASSRTSTRATGRCAATACPGRPAGTATGCRSSSRSRGSSGISSKAEIEAYGIAEFNQRCRESVFRYVEDWNRLTERIGFWIDLDDPYVTLDNDYIESVWWSLRKIWDDGRLYERHKVVPYCPRDGTALSSHEVAQGYQDVEDPSVYVRLPRPASPEAPLEAGDALLVWTTTPWTLITNAAVAVGPEIEYVRARPAGSDEVLVVAAPLVERVLGEGAEVLDALSRHAPWPASRYEPPFPYITDYGPRGHTVLEADFVTTERGHRPGAHRDRLRRGRLPARRAVRDQAPEPGAPDGTFDERITDFAGRSSRTPTRHRRGAARRGPAAARRDATEHSYPHCWRCERRSSTTRSRAGTCAPPTSATGCWPRTRRSAGTPSTSSTAGSASGSRATSTGRSPASATGARRCRSGSAGPRTARSASAPGRSPTCASAAARCRTTSTARTSTRWSLRCEACGGEMRRVRETIDAWYDSGSMPFAQFHYPFEGEELFKERFPADFISEAIDQTRGWFYSLLAISVLVFDRDQLPQLRLPRPDPRPRGPEDVEEPRQRRRSLGGDRPPRRRRLPLVLLHRPAAVGRLPLLRRHGRRVGAPVHAHALEHVRVLGPVRERRGARHAGPRRLARRTRRARPRGRPRPLGAVAPPGHDRGR